MHVDRPQPARLTRAAAAIAALAFCKLACKSSPAIEVDVPSDVAYAAVLVLGEDGSVLASSHLTAWRAGEPLPIVAREGDDAVIVAYSAAQLDPLLESKDVALRTPRGCEQKLPAPIWFAAWTKADQIVAYDAGAAPQLTAAGVELACRDLSDLSAVAVSVDLRCNKPRCGLSVDPLTTCTLQLDMSSCDIGRVTATFDLDGKACLDFSGANWVCSPREATYPAAATHLCTAPDTCELDVHAWPVDHLGEVDVFEVFPNVEEYLPRLAGTSPVLLSAGIDAGYLYDFHLREKLLMVAAVPDTTARDACPDNQVAGRVLYFDTDTMAPAGTSSTPPCLQRLVPDPHGGGFIATYARGELWRLGRFDRGGRLSTSFGLDLEVGAFRLLQLEHREADDTLLALVQDIAQQGVFIHVFDASTLQRLRVIDSTATIDGVHFAFAGPEEVALAASGSRRVVWIDLRSGAVARMLDLPSDPSVNHDVFGIDWDPLRGSALVLSRGLSNVYVVARDEIDIPSAVAFERNFAAISGHLWPKDHRLALIGGTEIGHWKANIALFDSETNRFLPGMRALGHGVVSRIREDESGRIWALLPWSAKLARIRPP